MNEIKIDEIGKPNGVLLVNKPKDITSHDVVDRIRKKYKTRKVGHAGTLDPFATGLLIVLIGKATKLSDTFLGLDKTYIADVLFGVSTNSGDIEGEINQNSNIESESKQSQIKKSDLENTLNDFMPSYVQYVPVFSSVKVNGQKLRVLARRFPNFEIKEANDSKMIHFKNEKGEIVHEVNLPKKEVKLYEIELMNLESISAKELQGKYNFKAPSDIEFSLAKVRVKCSKGTYIRQLAIDLGEKLEVPAMLVGLERTQIGDYKLEDAENLE